MSSSWVLKTTPSGHDDITMGINVPKHTRAFIRLISVHLKQLLWRNKDVATGNRRLLSLSFLILHTRIQLLSQQLCLNTHRSWGLGSRGKWSGEWHSFRYLEATGCSSTGESQIALSTHSDPSECRCVWEFKLSAAQVLQAALPLLIMNEKPLGAL